MPEQDGGVEPEPSRISRRNLLKGAAAITGLAALGQEAKPASAQTPTPAQTPTADADAAKITALKTAIVEQEKRNAQKTEVASLEKTATAISQPPANTPKPTETSTSTSTATSTGTPKPTESPKSTDTPKPTNTPTFTLTPAPTISLADKEATREAREDEAFGKEKARLQAEYERTRPKTPTPAVVPPAATATPAATPLSGGIPVIGGAVELAGNVAKTVAVPVVTVAVIGAIAGRINKIRNFVEPKIPQTIKDRTPNWVKRVLRG